MAEPDFKKITVNPFDDDIVRTQRHSNIGSGS